MSEEKNPRQYFYQLKENEESQVVHHNSCLMPIHLLVSKTPRQLNCQLFIQLTLSDSLRKPDKKTCRKHIMYKLCNALWRKRK